MTVEAAAAGLETSRDALMGGRVVLVQPRRGYRAAIDPVLLARFAPSCSGQVVDLGCGVGAALLCHAAMNPDARYLGIDQAPELVELLALNAAQNGMGDRITGLAGDVFDAAILPAGAPCDLVLMNPPFLDPARADPSPDPMRRRADVEAPGQGPDAWIARALGLLRHKGHLVLIQRADRLDAVMAALAGRAGGIVLRAVHPRAGTEATRILVAARKGVRTALRIAAPLILHQADGAYTAEADALLRGA